MDKHYGKIRAQRQSRLAGPAIPAPHLVIPASPLVIPAKAGIPHNKRALRAPFKGGVGWRREPAGASRPRRTCRMEPSGAGCSRIGDMTQMIAELRQALVPDAPGNSRL